MEQVSVAVCQFLEELLISSFQQLFERRQISCTVLDALAALLACMQIADAPIILGELNTLQHASQPGP